MALTLSDRLTRFIKTHGGWIASGDLQRIVSSKTTYTPQTTGRVLRQLQEDGVLEVQYRNPKHHAWYRYKQGVDKPTGTPNAEMIKWFEGLLEQ